MAENVVKVRLGIDADITAAKKAISSLEASLTNLRKAQASRGFEDFGLNEAVQNAKVLESSLNRAFNQNTNKLDLSVLNKNLREAGTSVNEISAQFLRAGTAGQQAFMSLATAVAHTEVPLKTANRLVQSFARTLKNTAQYQISATMYQGVTKAISDAISYTKNLNSSLNDIRIVTGQSAAEMAKFAQAANASAQKLSTTTNSYAKASLIFYQQGLSDAEVKKRTDAVIKMANVTKENMEDVSSYMTAVWNNFDDGSKSLEHYADVMTALGAATASSTKEIAAGLEKFASIGKTIGLSYDYATSALATIVSKTRQSADTVGTGLRTIFSRLQGLSLGETLEDGVDLNKYSNALKTVGVNVLDATGNMRNMDAILESLAGKWQNLSAAQKTALAQTVGGVRQYTTLISLMDNWDSMKQNLNTAKGADGSLQRQQDIYAESWEAAASRSKAAVEELFSTLLNDKGFIKMTNGITAVTKAVTALANGFGGLPGILSTVGMIATKVFSQQITSGISDSLLKLNTWAGQFQGNSFLGKVGAGAKGILTGKTKSYAQVNAEKEMANTQAGYEKTKSQLEASGKKDSAEYYSVEAASQLLAAKQKLIATEGSLTAAQKARAQADITAMAEEQAMVLALRQEKEALAKAEKQSSTADIKNVVRAGSAQKGTREDGTTFVRSNDAAANWILSRAAGYNASNGTQGLVDLRQKQSNAAYQTTMVDKYSGALKQMSPDDVSGRTQLMASINKTFGEGTVTKIEDIEKALQKIVNAANAAEKEIQDVIDGAKGADLEAGNALEDYVGAGRTHGAAQGMIDWEEAVRTNQIPTQATTVQEQEAQRRAMEKMREEKAAKIASGMQKASQAVMSFSAGLSQASTLMATLGDESASTAEKITSTMSVASSAVSAFATGGILGGVAYLAGFALTAGLDAIDKAYRKEEIAAEQAQADAEALQDNYKTLQESYDNLLSTFDAYKDGSETLDSLITGTDEWKEALIQTNEAALQLINSLGLMEGQDYTIGTNGEITFTKEGQNRIDQAQSDKLQETLTAQSAANLAQAEAASARAKADLDTATKSNDKGRWATAWGNAAAGAGTGALIGTAIGGWAMGLGTAIGTIIGGVGGLLGGLWNYDRKQEKDNKVERDKVDAIVKKYEDRNGTMTDSQLKDLIDKQFAGESESYKKSILKVVKSTVDANKQLNDAMKLAAQNVLNSNEIYNSMTNSDAQEDVSARASKIYKDAAEAAGANFDSTTDEETRKQWAQEYAATLTAGKQGVDIQYNDDGSFTYSYIGDDGHVTEDFKVTESMLRTWYKSSQGDAAVNAQVETLSQVYTDLREGKIEGISKDSQQAIAAMSSRGNLNDMTGDQINGFSDADLEALTQDQLTALGFVDLADAKAKRAEMRKAYVDEWNALAEEHKGSGGFYHEYAEGGDLDWSESMSLNAFKNFDNTINELEKGPIAEIGKKLNLGIEKAFEEANVSEEDRTALLDQISQIDWSDYDAFEQFEAAFEGMGYSIDTASGEWDEFITQMRQASGAIPDFTKLKNNLSSMAKITKDLKLGDIVSEEDYDTLVKINEAYADLFVLQADGSRKFIGNADNMREATKQMALEQKELLDSYKEVADIEDVMNFDWGSGEDEGAVQNFAKLYTDNEALQEMLTNAGYTKEVLNEIFTEVANGDTTRLEELFAFIQKATDPAQMAVANQELEEMVASTATTVEELQSMLADGTIGTETYSKSLIALASGYEYCAEAIKEYQEALASGDADRIQAAEESLANIVEIEREAAKYGNAFTNALSGRDKMSVDDLVALKEVDPSLYGKYLSASDDEWYEASYEAYMEWLNSRIAGYPKDSAAYAALMQEKKAAEAEYYETIESRATEAAENITAAWEQTHTAIEDALSLLGNISIDNPFSSLSYTEIEEIRQALLEAGYTAEEVDRKIRNIGKAEQESDVAALWEAQRLKTDLYLANISAYETEQDQYKDLLGDSEDVTRVPSVTRPTITGFQGEHVNEEGVAEVPAELKLNSNVTIDGLEDLGNGTYAVHYTTPEGTEKTLKLTSLVTITGIKDNGDGSYSYSFTGPDNIERSITVAGGVTLNGVNDDGAGGYSYSFTGPDNIERTMSVTGGVTLNGVGLDGDGNYIYSITGPDNIERTMSVTGGVTITGTAYNAETGEYTYAFKDLSTGKTKTITVSGGVTITGTKYDANTGSYTYSLVNASTGETTSVTVSGGVTITGTKYDPETGTYTYSLVDASTGETKTITVSGSVSITGTHYDAETGTYSYAFVDNSTGVSKTINVSGGVSIAGAKYDATTGVWSYSFQGTTCTDPKAIAVGGSVDIVGARETEDGHWTFDFQATNTEGELETYSFTANGTLDLTGADYVDGKWQLQTASGTVEFDPSISASADATSGWRDNGDGTYSYLGANGEVQFTASILDASALDALPKNGERRELVYDIKSQTAGDIEKRLQAKKDVMAGLDGTVWKQFSDQSGWDAFWNGGDADFKKNLAALDGDVSAYLIKYGANGKIAVQNAMTALTNSLNQMITNLGGIKNAMKDTAFQQGVNLLQGLILGYESRYGSAASYFMSASEGLLDVIRVGLREASPSKATIEMGQYLMIGLQQGFDQTTFSADSLQGKVLNAIQDTIENIKEEVSGEMSDIMALEQYIGLTPTSDENKVGGTAGAYYATNGSAATVYETREEAIARYNYAAMRSASASSTNSNIAGSAFQTKNIDGVWKIFDNAGQEVITDKEFASEWEAMAEAYSLWLTERVSAVGLKEVLNNPSVVAEMGVIQGKIIQDAMAKAFEKASAENDAIAEYGSIENFLQNASVDEIAAFYETYVLTEIKNANDQIGGQILTNYAQLKDDWISILTSAAEIEKQKAKEIYETWQNTFDAIVAARKAAYSDKSYAEALSDEEYGWLALDYLKRNGDGTYDFTGYHAYMYDQSSNRQKPSVSTPTQRVIDENAIDAYETIDGTLVTGYMDTDTSYTEIYERRNARLRRQYEAGLHGSDGQLDSIAGFASLLTDYTTLGGDQAYAKWYANQDRSSHPEWTDDDWKGAYNTALATANLLPNMLAEMATGENSPFASMDAATAKTVLFADDKGTLNQGVMALGNGYYMTSDGTFYQKTVDTEGVESYSVAAMWQEVSSEVAEGLHEIAAEVAIGDTFESGGVTYKKTGEGTYSQLTEDFGVNLGEGLIDKLMEAKALTPDEQMAYADSVIRQAAIDDKQYIDGMVQIQQAAIDKATSDYESQNAAINQAIKATRGEEDVSVENAAILDEIFGGSSWRTMTEEELAAKNVELAGATDQAVNALMMFIAALQQGAMFVGLDENGVAKFTKDGRTGTAEELGITIPDSKKSTYKAQAEFDQRLDNAQQAGFSTLGDQDAYIEAMVNNGHNSSYTDGGMASAEEIQEALGLDSLEEAIEKQREYANQMKAMERGFKDLSASGKQWIKTLKEGTGSIEDQLAAQKGLRKGYKDILGFTDKQMDALGDSFLQNADNLKLAEIAASDAGEKGQAALDQLQAAAASAITPFDDLVTKVNGTDQTMAELADTIAGIDLDIGAAFEGADYTAVDNYWNTIIDKCLASGDSIGQAVETANAALNGLGVDVNPQLEIVTETLDPAGFQAVLEKTGTKTVTVPDGLGGTREVTYDEFKQMYEEAGSTPIPFTYVKGKGAPGANKYTKRAEKPGSNSGKRGGGGGGGGRRDPRRANHVKKEDYIERYHEIDNVIDDLADAYERLNKQEDRAWGKNRIDAMKAQTAVIEQQVAATKEKIRQAEQYLKLDKKAAEAAGWLFDENGNVMNYDELMSKQVDKYNSAIDAYNNMSASEQEKLDEKWSKKKNADGEYYSGYEDYLKQTLLDGPKEALEQYEETMELLEDLGMDYDEFLNAWHDNIIGQIQTKLDTTLEVTESQLEYLDHKLSRISDDAYKTAEALTIMAQQMEISSTQFDANKSALNDLLQAYNENWTAESLMNGDISIDDLVSAGMESGDIELLQNIMSGLMDASAQMSEQMVNSIESMANAFDEFNADMDRYISTIEHAQAITSTYRNIIDLTGRTMSGFNSSMLKSINDATVAQSKANLSANKTKYDTVKVEYEEAKKAYEAAQASYAEGGIDAAALKAAKDTYQTAQDNMNEAQESFLSSWEAALQAAADAFQSNMEAAMRDVGEMMSGHLAGGLAELEDQFAKLSEQDQNYVDDYEKIYQLTKMTRDLTDKIDNTSNVRAQKELLKYQKEINGLLESDQQMSQYDIDYLRKKIDLKMAEIALDEAQSAKSQVTMRRDSEGNYNYVYTADEDAVEKAESEYADKLYEMQKANDEYITSLSENMANLSSQMLSEIAAIDTTIYDTEEKYQAEVQRITDHYTNQMAYYNEEMNKVLGNNKTLYEQDWTNFSKYTGYKLSAEENYVTKWSQTVLSQVTGFETQEGFYQNFNEAIFGSDPAHPSSDSLIGKLVTAYTAMRQQINEANEAAGVDTEDLASTILGNIQAATDEAEQAATDITTAAGQIVTQITSIGSAVTTMVNNYADAMEQMEAETDAMLGVLLDFLAAYGEIGDLDIDPGILAEINRRRQERQNSGNPASMDTGGYTGSWGSEGRLALLHQKELVLNASDTANMLASVGILRQIANVIDLNALASSGGFGHLVAGSIGSHSGTLQQEVHIEANFPNATDKNQIEDAFKDIVNLAAQFANR